MGKVDEEKFLCELGDVFGFLMARSTDDIEAANAILAHTDVAQLLINMTDFCLSQLQVRAEEVGATVELLVKTLALSAQAVGPDILKMMEEMGGGRGNGDR